MVLQKLKKDAEAKTGETIEEAIITVPAYFNDSQRQATKNAGEIAGLKVRKILNEPTAAAVVYGFDKRAQSKVLVFDFGGGTLDVSIIEVVSASDAEAGENISVIGTGGDTHLGGDDFDQEIISYVLDEFKKQEGVDLSKDKLALQRIKDASEKAKRELSNVSETEINLPFITSTNDGPKHLLVKLSRSKFNELTKDLIKRSIDCMKQTLKEVDLSLSDIDDVILVGGTTRIPAIQEKIKELSGKEPKKDINPDEVVATGAAIVAGSLQGDVKDLILLDVTPLTLSIETLGGISTPMIEKNTYIPAKKTETFSTAADNQTAVSVHVLQGERKMASDNKTLANFVLDGIAPAPRGVPQIEVSFDIDKNGILNVSAVDKKTNKKQSVKIEASTNLSKEEIEKMKQEAKENEEKDNIKKEYIDLKNQSEQLIYTAKTSLKDSQDKINEDLKNKVEEKIKNIEQEKDKEPSKENIDILKEKFDDLSKTISEIGSQVYKDTEENKTENKTEESKEGKVERDDNNEQN
jgi:molecular chaperone DnaK